ncbi:MAG: von Willebrand factor type A domain-containing protein, partial [Bacteroidota bacterium]
MKIQTWLYCFFLLPHFLFGQKQIKGQILDGANHQPLAGVHVYWLGAIEGSVSNASGEYQIAYNPLVNSHLRFVYPGYRTLIQKVEHTKSLNVQLWAAHLPLVEYDTLIAFDPETYEEQVQIVAIDRSGMNQPITNGINASQRSSAISSHSSYSPQPSGPIQTSNFARIEENQDQLTFDQPLSTFSIDVDQAAYSIVRNAIHQEGIVPIDAVRIEELINYFNYDYPQPEKEHPFSIYTELAECPWNAKRQLLHIGLKGREIVEEELPPSHLVFLLDVSGSMDSPQKLPLLKKAFLLLIESLRPEDKVSIVVYAGAAGLVLPPTTGDEKATIRHAIEHLTAGGSTAGGEGIQLAYQLAKDHFLPEGNNRVILATDGDFNVGISSDGALSRLIEQKREEQIFLTVIGLGTGNYKDHKLELLADKGNGHYVYLDNEQEARKVFVEGLRSNLYSIAKDV